MELYEKTTPPTSTQEVYERVRSYLGRPGASKCVDGGHCVYKDNGNRCAIGGILPAELLDKAGGFEGSVYSLMEEFPEIRNFFAYVDGDFLINAQDAHDETPDDLSDLAWQYDALRRLDGFAQKYGLQVVSS